MKNILLTLAAVLVLCTAGQANAQIISGFGSSELNPVTLPGDLTGGWTGTETTTTLSTSGSDLGGGIFSTLKNSVTLFDPGTNSVLLLKGELNAPAPVGTFTISLYDSSFDSFNYTFTWGSFTNGTFTTIASSTTLEAGNFTGPVTAWGLTTAGAGANVQFTFDTITSVPEPSTYAMLIAGLGALYFFGRRRKARA